MKKLKELREEYGETQAEVAALLGISGNAITKYEKGQREPSLKNLKKLASHFNVSVDELLADIEVEPTQKREPRSNLQRLRVERGMTLNELSAETGIYSVTISQYETHKRRKSMGKLIKLADYFNVSLDYLFDRTSEPAINRGADDGQH